MLDAEVVPIVADPIPEVLAALGAGCESAAEELAASDAAAVAAAADAMSFSRDVWDVGAVCTDGLGGLAAADLGARSQGLLRGALLYDISIQMKCIPKAGDTQIRLN